MKSCVLEGVFLTVRPPVVHKPAYEASQKPLCTPADQGATVRLHSGADGSAAWDSEQTVTFIIIWLRRS